jgi:hypothetical protein
MAARKIAYMTSLMAEIPTRWSYNTLERKPELWENYEEFIRNWEIIFNDKDERTQAANYLQTIRKLRQTLRDYATEFAATASSTGYDDLVL